MKRYLTEMKNGQKFIFIDKDFALRENQKDIEDYGNNLNENFICVYIGKTTNCACFCECVAYSFDFEKVFLLEDNEYEMVD